MTRNAVRVGGLPQAVLMQASRREETPVRKERMNVRQWAERENETWADDCCYWCCLLTSCVWEKIRISSTGEGMGTGKGGQWMGKKHIPTSQLSSCPFTVLLSELWVSVCVCSVCVCLSLSFLCLCAASFSPFPRVMLKKVVVLIWCPDLCVAWKSSR